MTYLFKIALVDATLDHFEENFNDSVYQSYKFPPSRKDLKLKIMNALANQLSTNYRGEWVGKATGKFKGIRKNIPYYTRTVFRNASILCLYLLFSQPGI